MLKKLNIKEVIKVLLNILNIHENWRKYVKAYFERLSYMNKDFNFNHHSFYLDLCTIDYWMNSHNKLRF